MERSRDMGALAHHRDMAVARLHGDAQVKLSKQLARIRKALRDERRHDVILKSRIGTSNGKDLVVKAVDHEKKTITVGPESP